MRNSGAEQFFVNEAILNMRSQYAGHFSLPESALSDIWENGMLVFDTNVLLSLYRYSETTRKELLTVLTKNSNRCWLPEQCAYEFFKNRLTVISDQTKSYDAAINSIAELEKKFDQRNAHPFLTDTSHKKLAAVLKEVREELAESGSALERKITDDEIKEEVAAIFDGKVGSSYTEEELLKLFDLGEGRYFRKIPPGYMDEKKTDGLTIDQKRQNYGDLIFWQQTIDHAKSADRSAILICDDKKEDWWQSARGKTVGPRAELVEEFLAKTGRPILIYTTERFLQLANEKLNLDVSAGAIDEVRADHADRKAKGKEVRNFAITKTRDRLSVAHRRELNTFVDDKPASYSKHLSRYGSHIADGVNLPVGILRDRLISARNDFNQAEAAFENARHRVLSSENENIGIDESTALWHHLEKSKAELQLFEAMYHNALEELSARDGES